MVFVAVERTGTGEAADFSGECTPFDTEEVRKLLAVERNVEFALAAPFRKSMKVGKKPVFSSAVGKYLDFCIQL